MTLAGVTCAGAPSALPLGLIFTDNGNGSATLAGKAQNGSDAGCRKGYTLTVLAANGADTANATFTLHVDDVIVPTSAPDRPTFVAGAPNSYVMTASAIPTAAFAVDPSSTLPGWLSFTHHRNGTATLTGVPPEADAGTTVSFDVDITNGKASPVTEPVTIKIARVALTAASPPAGKIGERYSYTFTASSKTTFGVAHGSTLPPGLRLSKGGVLSGVPSEIGRWPVNLTLKNGGSTITTSSINMVVNAGPEALEITQFRSFGPNGQGDWFVQVENTTRTAINLAGWNAGVLPAGGKRFVLVPFGHETLQPGGTAVVGGPAYSLSKEMRQSVVGPGLVGLPGGFEVVAPDGSVTDLAGEAGAPKGTFAGTGAAFPQKIKVSLQDAFVRQGFADNQLVNTGNNAADFTYSHALLPQVITFTSTPPSPALVGRTYAVTVTGGGSGEPITLKAVSPAEACSLSGSTVSFTGIGACELVAHQAAQGSYLKAQTAVQRFVVYAAQKVKFTSTPPPPARVGETYVPTATGGASGNPVTYSIGDPSEGACTLSGSTVTFTGPSGCVVVANQAGRGDYLPASPVSQRIVVERGLQAITFTSTPPSPATLGGSYTVTATGGPSGEPVTFALGRNSTRYACSITGNVINFDGVGKSVVEANQKGDKDYEAAPAVYQRFSIQPYGS